MADERLRLVAEVQDQFTGPLDKLTTALRRTASTGSKTAKDIAKDFEGFQGTLGKATSTLQGMLSPLQSLGVAGLGAGLGLSGIATALRSFSSGTQQLSILSKESGLAIDQLRALGQLGDRFGVSAETMNSGVIHLSEGMRKLKMGYGELQTSLLALNKGDFAEKLFNAKDMQAALDAAMEELSKEKDSYKRRQLAEVIFGTKDFGVIAGQVAGKYREVMQEIIASQGVMTKETEKAAAEFEKNMSRMGSAAERLKLNTLGPLLKGLNTIVESGDRAGIRGNAEAMDKDLNTRLADATKRRDELAKDPTKNADEIKSLEKEIRNLTDAIRRSKDGAGPSGVSAIPMSLSGGGIGGGGGARIYTASLGGGGGFGGGSPTMGGFGGPLPTLGGGYGGVNPNVSGGGSGRGYGGGISPNAPIPNSGSINATTLPPIGSERARGVTSAQGRENVASWLEFFQRDKDQGGMGLQPDKARAMVAMLQGESGRNLNPGAYNPNDVNGPSGGTAQWHDKFGQRGRLTGLREFAARLGRPWNDRGVQQEFFKHEMNTSHRRALRAIEAAPDGPSALYEGIDKFESPANKGGEFRKRMGNYRALEGVAPGPSPSGSADVAGGRMGDSVMRRFYGDEAPTMKSGGGKGSLDITLHGFPAGTRPRASMDDLFKDVNVSKKRQMETWDL